MANNNATTNLKLVLPVEENINWAGTINNNFEKIDDAVGEIETKYTTLVNTNIDNAAIFIDDIKTAVNFANQPDTNQLILGNITAPAIFTKLRRLRNKKSIQKELDALLCY